MSTTNTTAPFATTVILDMVKSGTEWHIATTREASSGRIIGKHKALTHKGAVAVAERKARKYLKDAPALALSVIVAGLKFNADGEQWEIGPDPDRHGYVKFRLVEEPTEIDMLPTAAFAERFREQLLDVAQPGMWKYEIEPKFAKTDKCFDSMISADSFAHAQEIVRTAAERLRNNKVKLSGRAWLLRLEGIELPMSI